MLRVSKNPGENPGFLFGIIYKKKTGLMLKPVLTLV